MEYTIQGSKKSVDNALGSFSMATPYIELIEEYAYRVVGIPPKVDAFQARSDD